MNFRWYLWALVFFAMGLVLGAAFVVVGPVFVVRILGTLAIAASVAGGAIALWTFRADDPWQWELYRFRIVRLLESAASRLRKRRQHMPQVPA